ncbi:SDR family oxidoreductase [Candidatus Pelagibacter sp.]|nr:SDR family oxidoreductase [Candidatus Pelagibacter sp.]
MEKNIRNKFDFTIYSLSINIKSFMNSGGSIINITSLAVEQGFSDNVAYVAPKGGLKQLTKAMTVDFTKNIRVNSVGLGYVKTKMTEKSWLDKKK